MPAAARLSEIVAKDLAEGQADPNKLPEIIRPKLEAAMKLSINAGEVFSRVVAHIEAEGTRVRDSSWDYLTALQTNQTWKRYRDSLPFNEHLVTNVGGRMFKEAEICSKILGEVPTPGK